MAVLAAVAAADELAGGSPAAAKRYLCLAERALASEGRLGGRSCWWRSSGC